MVGADASDAARPGRAAGMPARLRTGLPVRGVGRGRTELSRRTRSGLLDALDECARRPESGGHRPAGSVQFLRPPAVPDHLGCIACAAADTESRRWFFFFETETNHDPDVRARIRAAGGLCAPHTRRLLDSTPAAWLARGIFADLLRNATAGPSTGRRSTRRRGVPPAADRSLAGRLRRPLPPGCPVCVSVSDRVSDTLRVLAAALDPARGRGGPGAGAVPDAAETAAAYRAGPGLCVPHGRRFLLTAGAAAGALVARHLVTALSVPPEEARPVLLGGDDDGPARARIRTEHAAAVLEAARIARQASFAARVRHLTSQPCCPVCAARDRAGWRLLGWLAGQGSGGTTRDQPDALAMREQLTAVCGTHLADLVRADGGGAWLSAPVASVVRLAAARARDAALTVAEAAAGGVAGSALYDLAVRSGPRMSCPVCTWSAEAAAREAGLVRLVGADPRWATAVSGAHGLCARCLPAVATGPADPWSVVFGVQARQLSFEVDEAVRTDSWSSRWDVRGAEMSSWQRVPFLLDGAVLGPRPPV